jgi:hypothetical protein
MLGVWLALALGAAGTEQAAVTVEGAVAQARIEGEREPFLYLVPGEGARLVAQGPGKLVLDLRGFAGQLEPSVAPVVEVHVDGEAIAVPPIDKPANRRVEHPVGYASTATLLEVKLGEGPHAVELRAGGHLPALVQADVTPDAPELPLRLPPRVHASPVATPAVAPAASTLGMSFEAMVGACTHLQIGGLAPLLGLGAEVPLTDAVGVGAGVDWLRYPLRVDDGRAEHTGALQSVPVLARLSLRFHAGELLPFVGLGVGLSVATVSLSGSGEASALLPTLELRGGVGMHAGPGQVVLQGRLLLAQGAFDGVAQHFQAGGAGAQIGYRYEL